MSLSIPLDEKDINLIEKSLELDRANSYAYRCKGIIFFEQQQPEEARRQFEQALRYGYNTKYGSEVDEYLKKSGE